MGARFQLEHANLVAYLTSRNPSTAPFAMKRTVSEFLLYLREGVQDRTHLVSSGSGWERAVSELGGQLFNRLGDDRWSDDLLRPNQIFEAIDPLRELFAYFDLYALVLPGREENKAWDGN